MSAAPIDCLIADAPRLGRLVRAKTVDARDVVVIVRLGERVHDLVVVPLALALELAADSAPALVPHLMRRPRRGRRWALLFADLGAALVPVVAPREAA